MGAAGGSLAGRRDINHALKVTPAMAAGVTDRLWEVANIVPLVEAREAKDEKKRNLYKKQVV
jgi:hypothetical protein